MTTKHRILMSLLLASLILFTACDGDDSTSSADTGGADASGEETTEEKVEAHICVHFEEGPAVAVTAAADQAKTLADTSELHHRIDVSLVDFEDGKGGWVAYASATAGHGILFLDTDVTATVLDANGAEVALHAEALTGDCPSVVAAWEVDLEVGLYHISFATGADSDVSQFSFVLARPDEHDDDEEH